VQERALAQRRDGALLDGRIGCHFVRKRAELGNRLLGWRVVCHRLQLLGADVGGAEQAPHGAPGARKLTLGRACLYVELLRDFFVREAGDVVQHENSAVSRREPCQRRRHVDSDTNIFVRRSHICKIAVEFLARVAPQLTATIHENRCEPRSELRLPAKVAQPSDGADPAFLQYIVRVVRAVSQKPQCQRVQGR
jgi:hypothetical protein